MALVSLLSEQAEVMGREDDVADGDDDVDDGHLRSPFTYHHMGNIVARQHMCHIRGISEKI